MSDTTFVVLDSTSERGKLWQKVTGRCSFEATPPIDGFYRLDIGQFDESTFIRICSTLAGIQGGTPEDVRAYLTGLGFIPLKAGADASFGASLRMVM